MRRTPAFVVALALVIAGPITWAGPVTGAAPSAGADPAASAGPAATAPNPSSVANAGTGAGAELRARRAEVLLRIASLTDRLEADEARVAAIETHHQQAVAELARTREALRGRAVSAYMGGVSPAPHLSDPARVYAEAAAGAEQRAVEALRQARSAAAAKEASARRARDLTKATTAELMRARGELDAAIARQDARDEAQRQAAAAREAALAEAARKEAAARADRARAHGMAEAVGEAEGTDESEVFRHRQASERQAQLMARWPFGPVPLGQPLPHLHATGTAVDGLASWYGADFDGRPTASGAIYDMEDWTVASKELPLGTFLLVSRGDRSVLLLVNDRGPYIDGRVLDLSHVAATYLGVGVDPVHAEVLVPDS